MIIQENQDLSIFETHESNVRGYSRAFPFVIEKSKGAHLFSTDGTDYLDFFAGASGLNYGHNHPAMQQAMIDYINADGIIHGLDMATTQKAIFIDTLYRHILTPRGFGDYKVQFTSPSGTNAVEAALKLARKNTGRTEIIAFENGFHGVSLGSLAATYNPHFRNAAGVPLEHVSFVPYDDINQPLDESLQQLEKALNDSIQAHGKPAAIVVESIQGEGGVRVARPEWLRTLRDFTKANDILFIADDIQAGCGRSGDFFGFEQADIKPDIITISKSISGVGLPMSIVLFEQSLDTWKPGEHTGTFRGNNLAFVTATVAIDTFWQNNDFAQEVIRKGGLIADKLHDIASRYPDHITEVRGRGMFYGLVINDPEKAGQITNTCFKNHLVIERAGMQDEVVKLLPPLITSDDELQAGLDIIDQSINQVVG